MALVDQQPPPRLGLNRIRTGSHPSLTHSSTTDGDNTHTGSSTCGGPESLLTPNTRHGDRGMLQLSESDEEIMDDDDHDLLQGPATRGYDMRNSGMVTRSMADLKGAAMAAGAATAGGKHAGSPQLSGRDRSHSTGASQTIAPGGAKPGYTIPSRPPNALISYPGAGPSSYPRNGNAYGSSGSSKPHKSSGFASFLRKLTGKKSKEPRDKVANPMDVLSRPDAPFRPVCLPDPATSAPRMPQRSMSANVGAGSSAAMTMAGRRPPMPARIQTEHLPRQTTMPYQAQTMPARRPTNNNTPPLSAPPVMAPMLAHYPVMAHTVTTAPAGAPPRPPRRESDPTKIPLPPSPTLSPQTVSSATMLESAGGLNLIDFDPNVMSSPPLGDSAGTVGSNASRQGGPSSTTDRSVLDLGGQISRTSANVAAKVDLTAGKQEQKDDDGEGEEDDLPAPLPMIRIPSNSSAQGRREPTLAHSPLSISSGETLASAPVQIPSKRDISPPGVVRSADGRMRASPTMIMPDHANLSLPPGAAPADPSTLARRDSKWRQSVMNLSDSVGSRYSQRSAVPPTSFDSYNAAQRQRANNRVSCQPTMHSAATIAEKLRAVQNKEEADMAETFFI